MDAGATVSCNAWMIGGLPFLSGGWDQAPGRLGDDYEAVALIGSAEAWKVLAALRGSEGPIEVDVETREVRVDTREFPQPAAAFREGAARVLLREGRVPLHGALVVPDVSESGLLILGESGLGKSSLAWLALSMGWRIVSDDYVALGAGKGQEIRAMALRKAMRVPAHLLGANSRALGRRMTSDLGMLKIRLDPNRFRVGAFLREASINRIAFLERADARNVRPLSPADTLERLMALCAPAMAEASSPEVFQLLARLAHSASATAAGLTRACLTDPHVIQDLAA